MLTKEQVEEPAASHISTSARLTGSPAASTTWPAIDPARWRAKSIAETATPGPTSIGAPMLGAAETSRRGGSSSLATPAQARWVSTEKTANATSSAPGRPRASTGFSATPYRQNGSAKTAEK